MGATRYTIETTDGAVYDRIIASPQLLAACEWVVRSANTEATADGFATTVDSGAVEAARAAIAKAKRE